MDGSLPLQTSSASHTAQENRLFIYDRKSYTKFLIDSGSVISLIPVKLAPGKHKPEDLTLQAANGSLIKTFGQRVLSLDFGLRREFSWAFIVADVKTPIIGADLLSHFGLVVDIKRRRLCDSITALSSDGQLRKASVFSVATLPSNGSFLSHDEPSYSDLLREYAHLSEPKSAPQSTLHTNISHHIVTTGPPVHERPRRLTGEKLAAARKDFDLLLYHGVIRPSSSQWASPLHLLTKKNGTLRSSGDYRKLNAQTVPDRYPIPRIEDILQRLHGNSVFSRIDLERAYHQIPVAPEDIPKTAITTPFGLFEFVGMPLGLRNATQTFQRFMDNILRGLDFAACYIDDVIVFSSSHEEHIKHLKTVLDILSKNHLTINMSKCDFGRSELTFLGFAITPTGFSPPTDKIKAVENYPKPQTIADLRRFLGVLNYYRSSIPHAAQQQSPLTEYLKGAKKKDKRKIIWTELAEQTFEACKKSLIEATQSSFLAPSAPLALTTDASDTAVGASLEQFVDDAWRPLAFFSKKLSSAEMKYSTYDRELLAIYLATKYFKHILDGREFIIRTDHRPLTFAFAQRLEKASPRQCRQLDYISQFCTEIVHINGEENAVADALSRVNTISMPTTLDSETIREAQENDDELENLQQTSTLNLQQLKIDGSKILCDISTGLLRPYLPKPLRRTAFDVVHGLAHPSGRTTSKALKEKFIWPGIKKDALSWARNCLPCQRAKIHRHNRSAPAHIEVPSTRFNHVHLDLITLPLINDYRYCLTIIDRFSRWPHAIPLKDIQADTVASAFYSEWICQFGTPLTLTSDQGAQFESTLFSSLARLIGANKIRTTAYHPQSNGMLERWHRSLKSALMCNPHIQWTKLLPSVLLGLRTAFKEDIGASPAELLFGTTLRVPGDFFSTKDSPVHPSTFVENLRLHFKTLQPTQTSHHTKDNYFFFKDLRNCSHVFRRLDAIKPPLTPTYSGPHSHSTPRRQTIHHRRRGLPKDSLNGLSKTSSSAH